MNCTNKTTHAFSKTTAFFIIILSFWGVGRGSLGVFGFIATVLIKVSRRHFLQIWYWFFQRILVTLSYTEIHVITTCAASDYWLLVSVRLLQNVMDYANETTHAFPKKRPQFSLFFKYKTLYVSNPRALYGKSNACLADKTSNTNKLKCLLNRSISISIRP